MIPDADILREQFEYLLIHAGSCNGQSCSDCLLLAHIREMLMERWQEKETPKWWMRRFHRVNAT